MKWLSDSISSGVQGFKNPNIVDSGQTRIYEDLQTQSQ